MFGQSEPRKSQLDIVLEMEFQKGRKLISESFNIWLEVKGWCEKRLRDPEAIVPPLNPLIHYRDYFGAKRPYEVDEIMHRSDPSSVASFDALVDEFNTNLDEFTKTGWKDVKGYLDKAYKIIHNS